MSPSMRGRGSKHQGRCLRRHLQPSPSMRGRGSKRAREGGRQGDGSRPPCGGVDRNQVAPSTAADILGSPSMRGRGSKRWKAPTMPFIVVSPSMRGRGSKRCRGPGNGCRAGVALHAGAWIETSACCCNRASLARRPPCGGVDRNSPAACGTARMTWRRPPSRGRGSKPQRRPHPRHGGPSPSMRGRGSKQHVRNRDGDASGRPPCGGVDRNRAGMPSHVRDLTSPSMRGRGSKRVIDGERRLRLASPSMRGRGSKLHGGKCTHLRYAVALHAGAWIETLVRTRSMEAG